MAEKGGYTKMKVIFKQCLECKLGMYCYKQGMKKCPKIEFAAKKFGIPTKMYEGERVDER